MFQLILASRSPRRQALLAGAGIPFRVVDAGGEEWTSGAVPRELPALNAARKARAVAALFPDAWVIGADTMILFGDEAIGKPRDLAAAEDILLRLAGNTHDVLTGIMLCGPGGREAAFTAATSVTFLPFGRELARRYLSLVPVLDKAGAYALQDHGEMLVSHVKGDPDNVVGLPTQTLFPLLWKLRDECS